MHGWYGHDAGPTGGRLLLLSGTQAPWHAGVPAVVRVVEEIKNAVGSCDWASPPVVDLRLNITADDSLVVVIRELVQCALLNSERGAERALAGTASQDLAQTLGMGALDTARWPGAKVAQATCEVQHIPRVLDWAVARHGGGKRLPVEQRAELVAAVQKTACNLALSALSAQLAPLELTLRWLLKSCVTCAQTWRARMHGRKTPRRSCRA